MLLLAILPLLFAMSSAEKTIVCDGYINCENVYLEPGVPITVTEEIPPFTLFRVAGIIDRTTFSQLNHVTSLFIEDSQITEIEDGAICTMPRLKEIYFDHNELPPLTKGHLRNCHNIKVARLVDATIEEDALESMPLEKLTLVNSGLPQSACSSPKLGVLELYDMPNFNLTQGHLMRCHQVKFLLLKNIGGVEVDAFDRMENLVELEINNVPMKKIESGLFRGIPNLVALALVDCGVEEIAYDAFDSLPNLRSLIITHSFKLSLSSRHFSSLRYLEYLQLLQTTDVALMHEYRFPSLKHLTIEVYDLEDVDLNLVRRNIPTLTKLEFYGNDLICNNQELVTQLKSLSTRDFTIGFRNGPGYDGFC